MNREIKFRGLKDRKWYFGDFCSIPNPHILFKNENSEIDVATCEIKTFGQFTGLKDKNGTLIFEGDVMKWDSGETGFVEYDKSGCQFRIAFKYDIFVPSCHIGLNVAGKGTAIVVGNIHENPELLNG